MTPPNPNPSSLPTAAPESVGVSPQGLAALDRLVESQIADDLYQGIVVLVARHGRVCHFEAYGKATDTDPMRVDSVFRLASMSKVVTAVAVMQLWDRGLIGLADPISRYIPAFADPQVAECRPDGGHTLRPASREILVHDLLNMTAGLTNSWWQDSFEPDVYKVVPRLYGEAGVRDDMNAPDLTLEENVARIATVPLIADPGTMFDYSNSSVDVLCRLVEVVSGQDFDTYLKEHVLGPLGMHETWFFIPDDQRHRLAEVYWPGRDERQTRNVQVGPYTLGPEGAHSPHHTYFSGAAGLHGTTADYYRFAQMLLNGGTYEGARVLSPAAVELMTTNQIGDLTNWQLTQNKWGYMLDIQEGVNAPRGSQHYLGGPGAYSWQGYFSTKFVNNPSRDSVILTMTTPAADGALPSNLRIVAAANAAMEREDGTPTGRA